jgi:DNA (cytosine-5)-methyltransferase 3A
MNVLSLFNGMSCGEIALRQVGIIPEIYYSSEIDKHAIAQTQLNFPNTIQLGSVVDVNVNDLQPIDLLIGGSPCQSFSFAGKRKGMATKCEIQITKLEQYLELKESGFEFEGQSYLFWEYMRILTDIRKYNPEVKFLLENVEMGSKWERILSEAIGIYGVHINSALVSAQNRKRIYWTNIQTKEVGLFGELHANIPQPEDKGILLKDILEIEVPEKYYLSEKVIQNLEIHKQRNKEAGNGFGAVYHTENMKMGAVKIGGSGIDDLVSVNSGCVRFGRTEEAKEKRRESMKNGVDYTPFAEKEIIGYDFEKMNTLTTAVNKDNLICVAMRGRGENNNQQLEPNYTGKTNTITSVQKDNLVMQLNPSKESGGVQPYQQNRIYDPNGISPCLNTDTRPHAIITPCDYRHDEGIRMKSDGKTGTLLGRARNDESCGQLVQENIIRHNTMPRSSTTGKGGTGHLSRNDGKTYCLDTGQTNAIEIQTSRIRRLTPTECARLQTIPDWYKWECSDTQIYRMCGNGWTVDVIAHIFSFLKTKTEL